MKNEPIIERIRKDIANEKKSELIGELNSIPIPMDPNDILIMEDWYYVVYEKSLLKPIFLYYRFKSQYFAQTYVDKYMCEKHYNIVKGSTLIKLGVTYFPLSMGTVAKTKKQFKHNLKTQRNYCFSVGLCHQRKKTLRTMYRRNLRRILLKLLNTKSHE